MQREPKEAEKNLMKDLRLESVAKDQILQIIEGGQRKDKKAKAQQGSPDGELLGADQLVAVHLPPGEE